MDNKELDRILKEKLQNKINPSPEFELKMIRRVEQEKQKIIEQRENDKNSFKKVDTETDKKELIGQKNHFKLFSNWTKVLSIAAVFVVVFTLGMNLKTAPIIGDESNADLFSISAIQPTNMESGILANYSEFIIQADGENLNTEVIRKSLYVEPALDYTIEKTLNKNQFKLKFKQNIPDNTIVKLQYVKDQITQDSWAYQTFDKLSVVNTYPYDKASDVSKRTVIDIEFSYANLENANKNITISPSVDGTWKHLGNIWRFTPKTELKENQRYEVLIKKGLKVEEQKLEADYSFSFNVGSGSDINYDAITMDGIITSKPDELVKITYSDYSDGKTKLGKVEISKFTSLDDFITYVNTRNCEKAKEPKEYDITEYGDSYVELKEKLPKGYYVAKIKSEGGNVLFDCPIQISEIAAFAMETERDVLVWVAKGNDLAQNIKVEYLGKNINTDKDGIAKFENVATGSESMEHVKVNDELAIGVYNYSLNEYPSGYIYTERPLYKSTDTINIWGFVPRILFYDKIDEEFYIELGEEGKQKINVDENGNFTTKIDLKNHVSENGISINLYYKDTSIANRYISIRNYELQNYTYEVVTNKKYLKAGDTFEFGVKVTHITGLIVPNKKVTIKRGENEIYTEETGEDGIAHFKLKIDSVKDETQTYPEYEYIEIYNGDDIEYTASETEYTIPVLRTGTRAKVDQNDEKYSLEIHKLATDRNVNVGYDLEELYDGMYDADVTIQLKEHIRKRYITGYNYNAYTKENEPEYSYYHDDEENTIKIKTAKTKNGKIELNKNEIKTKKDNDTMEYQYNVEFLYKDTTGVMVKEDIYYSESDSYSKGEGYLYSSDQPESFESSDRLYEIKTKGINDINYKYNVYRYLLTSEKDSDIYKIGEKINLKLQKSTRSGLKDIKNEGKILNITFKENITETQLVTENHLTHEFTAKDFPGIKMTSAYFVNGKFYRMPVKYYDFDEESKKIDIEITTDKDSYKPGEKVTLNIKTKNNGKPIKTNVNVSVVNEAVFEIDEDNTDLVEKIYSSKNYAAYTYSTYQDFINSMEGGAGGGDGTTRANFSDTAYFNTINTDNEGNAQVSFILPDNVTTYRATIHSTNKELYLGVNTKNITSKLDFFVQSTEPRGVKTSDDLVLNATSIADTKYSVDYEFTIKELNKKLTSKGNTNSIVSVNFGKLPFGTYHAVIKGKHEAQEDSIEYQFKVVKSTQEVPQKTIVKLENGTSIKPSKNPIVLELYNKNMTKYLEYIDFIESTQTERLDTQVAYNKVQEIKEKYYEVPYTANQINIDRYIGNRYYLRNLNSSSESILLTALVKYYAKDYYKYSEYNLDKDDNVFEFYLLKAAEGKPVLNDLIYLKETKDISNYNKLLVTLSLEFAGDYGNARDLYYPITLTDEEMNKYKSLVAIIETFIKKEDATKRIDELIKNSPADEYLRFAILSYFNNSSNEISNEETVKVRISDKEEIITLNGMKVKTLVLDNEQLADISFDTKSNDLMASYYYQTSLDDVEGKNIKKDIRISGEGDLKKGNTVNIVMDFEQDYEGEIRVALPNSLRLSYNYSNIGEWNKHFYVQSNNIEYVTLYIFKGTKTIKLPLLVTSEGEYKFESIVGINNGVYHISNPLKLNIK